MNKIRKLENLKSLIKNKNIRNKRNKRREKLKSDNVYIVHSRNKNREEGVTIAMDTQAEKVLTLIKIYRWQ